MAGGRVHAAYADGGLGVFDGASLELLGEGLKEVRFLGLTATEGGVVHASAVSDYGELLAIDARRPETPSPSRRCSATGTLRPALRNGAPAAAAVVSVRDSCFDPAEQVPNSISIQGLTTKQASPNGSGPSYPQRGIITVHGGRGWAIEGRVISDSPCSGIAPATGPESWYGPRSATQEANGTAPDFHASGFHPVRHNTIERCGQAGIIGMINGHSSIIEGNLIQDINWQQKLGGAETAGIKLHRAHDVLIRSNIIRRVYTTDLAGPNHSTLPPRPVCAVTP